ncbi:1,2-phenylacetyl-CoA epoxidase subunit PaaD [Kitasatospora sp. NBC_00458]|uniref:1,2-phenylacetyl-CoA epoxidase subunit PaaD n=1 Tax=Kitasatospora sp. NBC_00458 TaxID=2903568 RepID=UPI002E180103
MTGADVVTGAGVVGRGGAWEVASAVPDPELPMLTLADLGVLAGVEEDGGAVTAWITPTYSGCPAVAEMAADVDRRLRAAGFTDVRVRLRLDPPWSTDLITAEGRRKLAEAGIAPPRPGAAAAAAGGPGLLGLGPTRRATGPGPAAGGTGSGSGPVPDAAGGTRPAVAPPVPVRPVPAWGHDARATPVVCPLCGGADTEELSRFGSTACKALWRCRDCREPFERVKEI